MLFLGLLLVAATAAFTGLLITDNLSGGPEYTVTVLGNDVATMSTLEAFCAGLALALLFALGLMMALRGSKRTHRKAVTRREERRTARTAEAERDDLAAELDRERAARAQETRPAPADGSTEEPSVPAGSSTRHRGRPHLFGH